MKRLNVRAEIKSAIPIFIFFGIAFNAIHFGELLMSQPDVHPYTSIFGATLGALIATKVILVANAFSFINAFLNKPLVYNITWKTIIYMLFALAAQMLDIIVKYGMHHHTLNGALTHLHHQITQPLFWGIQIQLLYLLVIFVIGRDLTITIGADRMKQIFFG